MTFTFLRRAMVMAALSATLSHAGPARLAAEVVQATIDRAAAVSGRSLETPAARRAATAQFDSLVASKGDSMLKVIEDGGLEMLEKSAKLGDDGLLLASQATPAARRALALGADDLLPLARTVGVEALEAEAKAPGQATTLFKVFGADEGRSVARSIPSADLPRFIKYGERADSPATRTRLMAAYQEEGASLFSRIPPSLVISGGLSLAMLDAAHRTTSPFQAVADALANSPTLVAEFARTFQWIGGLLLLFILTMLLWRFGLMPWHRR